MTPTYAGLLLAWRRDIATFYRIAAPSGLAILLDQQNFAINRAGILDRNAHKLTFGISGSIE